jgi:hypothetical protein
MADEPSEQLSKAVHSVTFGNFPQRFGNALRTRKTHISEVHSKPQSPAGSTQGPKIMKVKLERAFHLGAAAVTLAAAFGLDPLTAALSLAATNIGLAMCARH